MFKPRRDNFSNKRKGGGKFGGFNQGRDRDFGGGWDREERAAYDAVCDRCGQPCTVPFKPTGSRPVLCNRCFKKEGDAAPKRFGRPDRERPSFRKEDRDFRKGGDRQPDLRNLERQLADINRKLDRLIDSMAPGGPKKKKKGDRKKQEEAIIDEVDDDEEDLPDEDAEDIDDDDLDGDDGEKEEEE